METENHAIVFQKCSKVSVKTTFVATITFNQTKVEVDDFTNHGLTQQQQSKLYSWTFKLYEKQIRVIKLINTMKHLNSWDHWARKKFQNVQGPFVAIYREKNQHWKKNSH